MFHMLTCFDLKPGIDISDFRTVYNEFVDYMRRIELVESSGPIGKRQRDTKMDTDSERDHEFFVIMSFRDRAQVDRAVELLYAHEDPSETVHKAIYSKVLNPVFICWQDLD
jgi:hypothetical protein